MIDTDLDPLLSFIVCALLVNVYIIGSKAVSLENGVDTENVRRTVTLTEKALVCKI